MLDSIGIGEQRELKGLKSKQLQDVLGDWSQKNLDMRDDAGPSLMDAVLQKSPESLAIYAAALAGLVHGDSEAFDHNKSSWADRLSTQYDRKKTAQFAKSL